MRRFRSNDRGLAEIVGTLMLVLIVVVAAVAFSAFVASYQAQLQAQEAYQHDQALESIHILSISPVVNVSSGNYSSLNFTMISEDVDPTTITGIAINGQSLHNYTATAVQQNVTPPRTTTVTVTDGDDFLLYPDDEATVWVNFTHGTSNGSFYSPFNLTTLSFVKVDVYTGYLNDFSRVFIPPSAILLVNTVVSGGTIPTTVTVLDGSQSVQPQGNATIVAWAWTVQNNTTTANYTGVEAETRAPLLYGSYTITLVVTNSDGLEGRTINTYQPG
jgi:flagellin-like protein